MLEGLKVIEMATYVAAPAAGAMLRDWGADVTKVEPLNGCPMRRFFEGNLEITNRSIHQSFSARETNVKISHQLPRELVTVITQHLNESVDSSIFRFCSSIIILLDFVFVSYSNA